MIKKIIKRLFRLIGIEIMSIKQFKLYELLKQENTLKKAEFRFLEKEKEYAKKLADAAWAQLKVKSDKFDIEEKYYMLITENAEKALNQMKSSIAEDKKKLSAEKEKITAEKEKITAEKERLSGLREQITEDKKRISDERNINVSFSRIEGIIEKYINHSPIPIPSKFETLNNDQRLLLLKNGLFYIGYEDDYPIFRKELFGHNTEFYANPTLNNLVQVLGYDSYYNNCIRDYLIDRRPFVAVDMGMNKAYATLLFAAMPNCLHVYGYELIPQIYSLAMKSIKRNGHISEKITAVNIGVSDIDDTIDAYFMPERDGASSVSAEFVKIINESKNKSDVIKESCSVKKASLVIEDIRKMHPETDIILKIDIEGAEYNVLRDLSQSKTLDSIAVIVGEFHDKGFAPIRELLKDDYGILHETEKGDFLAVK